MNVNFYTIFILYAFKITNTAGVIPQPSYRAAYYSKKNIHKIWLYCELKTAHLSRVQTDCCCNTNIWTKDQLYFGLFSIELFFTSLLPSIKNRYDKREFTKIVLLHYAMNSSNC
jgi:hypothetical protein